jgi:hypothetical protein
MRRPIIARVLTIESGLPEGPPLDGLAQGDEWDPTRVPPPA